MELPLEEKKELEEEEDGTNDEERENGDDEEKTHFATSDRKQEEAPQTVEPKQDNVLNLNNEVVKMRKEVKRVRALIIRKLTRQIAVLKKKKGKEAEIERNQRRAARLLEEIHAFKDLAPDLVTKTALQKNLSFDKVCKNPKSSISDRAIARIATHPQFSKNIEAIKAAVKAFKEERSKEVKLSGKRKQDKLKQPQHTGSEKEDTKVGPILNKDNDVVDMLEVCQNTSSFSTPKEKVDKKVQKKEMPQTENKRKKQIAVISREVKAIVKTGEESKFEEEKSTSKLSAEVLPKSVVEAESDLELSEDDEKEYFDDSTEERFHKQSSAESEESDNDFFLGKVCKFNKRKKNKSVEEEKVKHAPEVEGNSNNLEKRDKVQSELDELESRLKAKATMKSVFCSSLAGPKQGKGTVKGDSKFGEQDKQNRNAGGNKDFSKPTKFPKQFKGNSKNSSSKYTKPCHGVMPLEKEQEDFISIGIGKRQGKDKVIRQKDARGRSMYSHQAPQQPLHPSWEASKKRKEQQGQILAFQGKKIKFNDDD